MGLGLWHWKKREKRGSGHDFQFCEDRSSPRKMKGKEILACKLIQVISSSTRVETKRDQKLSGRSISNQILYFQLFIKEDYSSTFQSRFYSSPQWTFVSNFLIVEARWCETVCFLARKFKLLFSLIIQIRYENSNDRNFY